MVHMTMSHENPTNLGGVVTEFPDLLSDGVLPGVITRVDQQQPLAGVKKVDLLFKVVAAQYVNAVGNLPRKATKL